MPGADDRLERPDRKKRLSVYLDPDLMRLLADFADRREQSRSIIAEAAIASFLSPDADERKEAAISKRLDRIDRNIQRLERDIGIANEAFAIFMRAWLTSTAPLPETAQATARQGWRALRQIPRGARKTARTRPKIAPRGSGRCGAQCSKRGTLKRKALRSE